MDRENDFMAALAAAGGGADMWATGEGLGLDRGDTENVVTGLMASGLVEMVSLSGKVRLTDAGRESATSLSGGGGGGGAGGAGLSGWLGQVKAAVAAKGDLAADLACLEAQARRSKPLPPVVTACLEAAAQALEPGHPALAAQARKLMG